MALVPGQHVTAIVVRDDRCRCDEDDGLREGAVDSDEMNVFWKVVLTNAPPLSPPPTPPSPPSLHPLLPPLHPLHPSSPPFPPSPPRIQMEYCDRGCLSDVIKRGVFRPVAGRWGSETSLRALIRTAKEVAQVGGMDGVRGKPVSCCRWVATGG